ncbi:MAG: manganese efflux pump [Candidatus Sericytochromatia bacterium]|nr:manganese efflux pump [Candidatus Sericytochromatia bacterium]
MQSLTFNTLIIATLLGLSLAMDCFAIGISQGLRGLKGRALWQLAILFGLFQGGMLLLGHLAGLLLSQWFSAAMPWLAAGLLFWIGGKMLAEGLGDDDSDDADEKPSAASTRWRDFVVLSVATSIDAFAAGVSLHSLHTPLGLAVGLTALTSLLLGWLGGRFGHRLGHWLGQRAEVFGGLVLIGLGLKALLA